MAVAILTAAGGLAYGYYRQDVNVGVVLPHSTWRRREYFSNIKAAVYAIKKLNKTFTFMKKYRLTTLGVHMDMLKLPASPTSK